MNYLQLVQRLRREAGASGTGPTTTAGQSGETQRLVDWVRDAYLDIQNAQPHWSWLHKTATVILPPGGKVFHPVTDWGVSPLQYKTSSFWLYATSEGPAFGAYLRPEDYAAKIRYYGASTQAGRPTAFIVLPSREVELEVFTDAEYCLTFDYHATAETLTLDVHEPSMPEQYHMAIVWLALQYYADHEEVPGLRQTAAFKYGQIFNQMLRTEAPGIGFGGPLA